VEPAKTPLDMEVEDPLETIHCLHLQIGKPQLEDHLGNVDLVLGIEAQNPPTLSHGYFDLSLGKAHTLTKLSLSNEDALVQHPPKCSLNQLSDEPIKQNQSKQSYIKCMHMHTHTNIHISRKNRRYTGCKEFRI
jgi:hypothetical protein